MRKQADYLHKWTINRQKKTQFHYDYISQIENFFENDVHKPELPWGICPY